GGVEGLAEQQPVGSGAGGAEGTGTITFDGESRTVMITVVDRPDGMVRIDGWLAPSAPLQVELRLPEPAPHRSVTADAAGRFAFDSVPHGIAQFLVQPPQDSTLPRLVPSAFTL